MLECVLEGSGKEGSLPCLLENFAGYLRSCGLLEGL